MEDQLPDAPYGIICSIHGKQGLSPLNYSLQLSHPDSLWQCPVCFDQGGNLDAIVNWDDDRYEESEGFKDDGDCLYADEPDWDEVKGDLDYHERKENGEL